MRKPAISDEICYKLKQSLIVAPLKGKTSFKCKNWISLCTGIGIGTSTSTGTATMYVRRCMKINDNQNGGGVLFVHDYIAIKNTCIALDLELTNHLKVEHFICSFSWFSSFFPPQFFIVLCYIFIVPGLLLQLQRQFHSAISTGFSLLKSSMSSYLLCLAIMLCLL